MLTELSPRTMGLLSAHSPISPRNAINASFAVEPIGSEKRWVFQDVLPGGIAARAGLRPGDVLLSAAGKQLRPIAADAAEPSFEMGSNFPIVVSRGNPPQEVATTLETAEPKYKDNPYSEPTALTADFLPGGIAYLKVSLFPGKIGIDFAKELDAIFSGKFANAERLLVDLRGNPGGGIGGLTLMSYLTPDRLPIGYSWNRKMAQDRRDPASLPVFNKIPRSKLAIPGLAAQVSRENIHLCPHRRTRPSSLPRPRCDPREQAYYRRCRNGGPGLVKRIASPSSLEKKRQADWSPEAASSSASAIGWLFR